MLLSNWKARGGKFRGPNWRRRRALIGGVEEGWQDQTKRELLWEKQNAVIEVQGGKSRKRDSANHCSTGRGS